MPGEFDTTCKELRLKKMSVEAFKKEVQLISAKISNTGYEATADYNYHRQEEKVWNKKFKEQKDTFWSDHKKDFLRGVDAMNEGPKGRDPENMLKWIRKFPYVLARPDFLREKGESVDDNAMYQLAKAWTRLFSGEEAVEWIYNGKKCWGSDEKSGQFKAFQEEADKLFGPSAGLAEEETELDRLVEKMEHASMFTDSAEYKNLMSMTKMLNQTELVPHTEGLTPKQNQALKIATLKSCVDAYLDHKARDGVKRNVYHKLAAVEELNRYLCKRMDEIGIANIPDKKLHDEVNFPKTVEDEAVVLNETAPKSYSSDAIKANVEKANADNQDDPTTADECACTLDCMARILMRARHLELPDTQVQELTAVREQFFQNPGRGPEEAIDEIADDNLLKDLPQAY